VPEILHKDAILEKTDEEAENNSDRPAGTPQLPNGQFHSGEARISHAVSVFH